MASVSAAPTKHALQVSIDRAHVITRVATATSATAASPTAQRVSIVAAAAVRMQARAHRAQMHHPVHRTLVRAPST